MVSILMYFFWITWYLPDREDLKFMRVREEEDESCGLIGLMSTIPNSYLASTRFRRTW
jgi:hypothetical protein